MDQTARKAKSCPDETCAENWDSVPASVREQCFNFVYCPFCANEMVTRCSACGEAIGDFNYAFCPWCGARFED